jgi:methylated-DNA-[protein]-cysteine S-methyltransferase
MNLCRAFRREIDRAAMGACDLDRPALERHAAGCPDCRSWLPELDLLPASVARAFGLGDRAGTPAPRVAYWDSFASPIGRLHIATSEDGRVRRVSFRGSEESFVDSLLGYGWLPLPDRSANDPLRRQLDEYFAGRRRAFDLPVDLGGLSPFVRQVLETTAAVPAGRYETYGSMAALVGRPAAARAVGNALGSNPIPIVVPCHRVLAAGGKIGGYGGGARDLHVKRALLAIEGVTPP